MDLLVQCTKMEQDFYGVMSIRPVALVALAPLATFAALATLSALAALAALATLVALASALAIAIAVDEDYCRRSPSTAVQQRRWRPSMATIAVIVDGSNGQWQRRQWRLCRRRQCQ
jgi:hypothetical protein